MNYYTSRNNTFYDRLNTNYRILPTPNAFHFIAEGGDKYRNKEYWLRANGSIRPLPIKEHNSKLPNIPELDWVFIIKIIFSLYVIIIGYNSISGEKEEGTLRLTLSYSMSRIKILLAKVEL